MKRSKVGIALIIIGLVLLIFAPIWKWVVGPTFIKIPDDLNIKSVYEGTLKRYVDPDTKAMLPPDKPMTIPLTITRTDKSVPNKSTGSVAVVREQMNAKDPGGKIIISWDKYFAMNRRTAENVPKQNSDQDRTGCFVMLPMGAKKVSYAMWDDDTRKTGEAKFVKETVYDGNKNKKVKVYVYKAVGTDPMVAPPPGLPKEITGKEIKTILNNPNLALNDTEKYALDYIKTTAATIVAEPRTGAIVDLPSYHEEYSVDASAMGMGKIKLATLDYKQTEENIRFVVDDSARYFPLLDFVELWLPLILLVVGLVILIIGLVLTLRKKAA